MKHPIGEGIIGLIMRYEPTAIAPADLAAQKRVLADLATSVAGVLSFARTFHGQQIAQAVAEEFAAQVATEAPGIFDKAMKILGSSGKLQ